MQKASCEFQIFAKPAGAFCNLDCHYCYYLKKQPPNPKIESLSMSYNLLEEYIGQHIAASPGPVINFSWHGGEPTVLGLDYFREIVALQRKHQPPKQRIFNGLQTNGVLLDDAWCRFFAAEGFSVGLSLDGTPELHDLYRVTKGGEPTHRQAMRGFQLLQRHGIPCDILCAVHNQNVRYPVQVYRFFKKIGGRYVGFLPIVEQQKDEEEGVTAHTVSAEAFGTFLCTIFDEWVQGDVGRFNVQIFEEAIRPLQGLEHSLCIFRETCGEIPVIEHNGNLYSCDHFVDEEHLLGNIRKIPLVDMLESPEQKAFGQAKRDFLPRYCQMCEVLPMCNGGCPKDRFIRSPHGEAGLNYLCAGYKRFFNHSRPYFSKLVSLSGTRQASKQMRQLRQATKLKIPAKAGRNDLCPCGSGRKYKKCCLGK